MDPLNYEVYANIYDHYFTISGYTTLLVVLLMVSSFWFGRWTRKLVRVRVKK